MIADDLLKRNLAEMKTILGRLAPGDKQKDSVCRVIKDTEAYLAEFGELPVKSAPKKTTEQLLAERAAEVKKQKSLRQARVDAAAALQRAGFWGDGTVDRMG